MRRFLRCLSFCILMLAVPASGQDTKDDKKDPKKETKPAPAARAKKLDIIDTLTVVLGDVNKDDRTVTFVTQSAYGRGVRNQTQTLPLAEDVKVRRAQPPEQTDDKGQPKKYTALELRKLKGADPRLPGYTGDLDQVHGGESAEITLARERPTPKIPKAKGAKPAEEKTYVTMIVITNENKAPAKAPAKKK